MGYILDRAGFLRYFSFHVDIGRVLPQTMHIYNNNDSINRDAMSAEEYARRKASGISITGRILLNLWRCMRSEIKLQIYTRENVIFSLLKKRIPLYSHHSLKYWYMQSINNNANNSNYNDLIHIFSYFLNITALNLSIIKEVDLISRTSEMARVIGIDFFSVLSRGSQFRVESLLLRISKQLGYVMISPNKLQVANQAAMECIPLVMEPESFIYTDPVIVLDFQSLYPTIMMAYNICYTTCLGRCRDPIPSKLGVKNDYKCDINTIIKACNNDNIWISPNGIMFLKENVKPGILCRMVKELLQTRIMTKKVMKEKECLKNEKLQRLLNARQFRLV